MRTPPVRRGIPAALLALIALSCGSNDDSGSNSSVPAATAPDTADIADMPVPVDTGDIPLPTGTGDIPLPPPDDTSDIPPAPIDTADIPASTEISVTVGVDAEPTRLESVALGTNIVLQVTNPLSDDEFHLHGYELGDGIPVPAGQMQTFSFVADQAGEFELESHETGDVLLTISVS